MRLFFLAFLLQSTLALLTVKRKSVYPILAKIFGKNYHDVAVYLGKQLLSADLSESLIRTKIGSDEVDISSLQIQDETAERPYLACSTFSDFTYFHSFLHEKNILVYQVYSSSKDDLYCLKATLSTVIIKEMGADPNFTVRMLLPFPHLLQLDLTVHHLFHYLFQDSLKNLPESRYLPPMTYHPFVQHYLSSKRIGLSVLFHRDSLPKGNADARKRQLVQVWKSNLQIRTSHEIVFRGFRRLFQLFGSESLTDSKLRSKAKASLFPLGHYHTVASSLIDEPFDQCQWEDEDGSGGIKVIYQKYGVLLLFPPSLHDRIKTEHPTDRKHVMACLFRLILTVTDSAEVRKVAFSSPVRSLNDLARKIIQSGSKTGSEVFTAAGLTGEGIVLAVADTGIDENSCYFVDQVLGKVPRSSELSPHTDSRYRKVIQYVNFSGSGGDYSEGHGSHVAGSLAGHCTMYSSTSDNAAKNNYMGMVPHAKLAFFDMGMDDGAHDLVLPEDMRYVFHPAYLGGAHIHSDSWGGDVFYDSLALETDEYLFSNPQFMTFFAAGNSGSAGKETILSPATSKNAIAVACSETGHSSNQNIDYVSSFSSNGPTLDGRIKPDITGPGNNIFSVRAHSEHDSKITCDVEQKAGTSMATPVIAGNAGLILQYFQDANFWKKFCYSGYSFCQRGSFTPNGILLKALVLQSGKAMAAYHGSRVTPLGNPPDTYQGFGRMDLLNILPLTPHADSSFQLFLEENTVTTLTERRYYINFPSSAVGTGSLKITISWIDPPNHEFITQVMLNDLDLVVTDPLGIVFYGNMNNQLDQAVLGLSRDELNTNEQITITNPKAGLWTISVQGKAIGGSYVGLEEESGSETDSSVQTYAIVITSPRGTVVDASQTELTPITMALLENCPRYDAFANPKLSVDFAMWSRVTSKAWYSGDYYRLQQLSSSDPSSLLSYQGKFSAGNHPFSYDSLCLGSGEYSVELVVGSESSSVRGSQLAVPQCSQLYLTPMAPKQLFTIRNASFYHDSMYDNASYRLFPSDDRSCLSRCHLSNHLLLSLTLLEWGGEGFNGAYVTILEDLSHSSSTVSPYSLSDTLSWDYLDVHRLCLPFSSSCYLLQLSFPLSSEDDPQIYFTEAFHPQTLESCGLNLNLSITLAKFCVSAGDTEAVGENVTVTFYSQHNSIMDLGMKTTSFQYSSYYQSFAAEEVIVPVGQCSLPLKYVTSTQRQVLPSLSPSASPSISPTHLPTLSTSPPSSNGSISPSHDPTRSPTFSPSQFFTSTPSPSLPPTTTSTTSPTPSPSLQLSPFPTPLPTSMEDYDKSINDANVSSQSFECLRSCPRYPGDVDFRTINFHHSRNLSQFNPVLDGLCGFLQNIFPLCDSYSIAAGLCYAKTALNANSSYHHCLKACSIEAYCYLGAGLVTSCPDGMYWKPETDESQELRGQCAATLTELQKSSDNSDSSTSRDGDRLTVALLIAILVMMFLILLAFTGYSLWKSFFPAHFSRYHRGGSQSVDVERSELPSHLIASSSVVNTLHTSQQPSSSQGKLAARQVVHDDLSSDGFHSPVNRSPSLADSQRKTFDLPNLRHQIYENSKQFIARNKARFYRDSKKYQEKKKGLYEMVSIDDMNSSHPFRIAGSDDEEEEEEVEEENDDREGGGFRGIANDPTVNSSESRKEQIREEALEFLGTEKEPSDRRSGAEDRLSSLPYNQI